MINGNFPKIFAAHGGFEESEIVVFGAPFDSTTSYKPGARFAPGVVRNESYGFEDYSPYQGKSISDFLIHDGGDLELSIGETPKALEQIENHIHSLFAQGKFPVMIGGEHLVSLPAVKAAHKYYPDIAIIQFDAHLDLRDEYLDVSLSHATVMRRIWDLAGPGKIYQFGIRSGDRPEFEFSEDKSNGIFTEKFGFSGLENVIENLGDTPVYFTLDLDVLDPSVFPGTGTPEAGGTDYGTLHKNVLSVLTRLNVVGMDLCELAPNYDQSGISGAIACKILREALIAIGDKT